MKNEFYLTDKAKLSLYKKSSNSGISVAILEEVYYRGYSTWDESYGGTADSFAFDRVNSFIAGGYAFTLDEDLRNWFNPSHPEGGWKRINSKGEAIGPCAREKGEPKPKCMSNEKRAQLTKKERAAAVSVKRKHDPVADRKGKGGKPVNVSNYGKGKLSEDFLEEKNVPTNPSLWSKAKSLARSKFDVYPSAYANGWASKWYKSKGGGWKSVSEETDVNEACWKGYKQAGLKDKNGRKVPNCVPIKEKLDVPTPSINDIAKKYDKPVEVIKKALKKGIKIEKEHTTDTRSAAEIARDHLSERPDYYKKLEKAEKGPIKEDAEAHSRNKNKPSSRFIGSDELVDIYAKDTPGQIIKRVVQEAKSPAWQRKEGKREEGGLNQKGVESYRREHPGSKLKTAVTTDPSKLKKGSKAAKRRKSFCSRMQGMKNKLTSAKTARDPDSRINKSLRAWNCEETIYEAGLDVQATPTPTASSVGPSKLSRNARVELSRRGPAGGEGLRNVGTNRYSASSPTSLTGKRLSASTTATAKTLTPQRVSANQPAPKTAAAPTSAPKPTASFGSTSRPTTVSATSGGVEKSGGFKLSSGMTDAGKAKVKPTAPVEIPAAAGKAAGVLGKLARAATGPAATAAMTVMEPTPAGEKKSEFQRQADVAKGISYKSQGRSVSQYEKDVLTPKASEAPRPKVDAPTPPKRPEYFSRGQAFQAARSEVGGSSGKFSYGGKEFQTNVAGEKYKPAATLKTTSVKDESESGGTKKRIKEAVREKLDELSAETLGSYVTKAEKQMTRIKAKDPMNTTYGDTATFLKRKAGVEAAKDKLDELSVPAGTTGKRTNVSTPMVAVRMASGKIEKHPPGKSGSSGGGDGGSE